MNDAMKTKMAGAYQACFCLDFADANQVSDDFQKGFTACHDLLMPMLIEALPHAMANEYWPDGQTSALVKRIQEVIPTITKGETA